MSKSLGLRRPQDIYATVAVGQVGWKAGFDHLITILAIVCASRLRTFFAAGKLNAMTIKIVRRPVGEAPEWVRDAWIGLSLPRTSRRLRDWRGVGVISGPKSSLSQLWAVLTGKTFKVAGYAVNAKVAVACLADVHPEAAAWWQEHTPTLLTGRRYFVFDADACEPEPQSADGS
jgi:hypothetical protein